MHQNGTLLLRYAVIRVISVNGIASEHKIEWPGLPARARGSRFLDPFLPLCEWHTF